MAEESWVDAGDIAEMMSAVTDPELERYRRSSIFKVPLCFNYGSKKYFQPSVVSFGPYHQGRRDLTEMEKHKRLVLDHFLGRSGKSLTSLCDFVAPFVQDFKDAYDSLDPSWMDDTYEFLQVMLLDGCFIVEILLSAAEYNGFSSDDPNKSTIFSKHGRLHILPLIARDMLLLENQLPILLLHKLFVFCGYMSEDDPAAMYKLIIHFFSTRLLGDCLKLYPNTPVAFTNSQHILGVLRQWLLLPMPEPQKVNQCFGRSLHFQRYSCCNNSDSHEERRELRIGLYTRRSAIELQEAGIQFKKSETRSLKGVSFNGGILRLPPIIVDDITESTMRNLLAYEGLYKDTGSDITSYICLMDSLINIETDVKRLISSGIIINFLGSDRDVAHMFNSLSRDLVVPLDCGFIKVQEEMNRYCSKPINKWRLKLVRTFSVGLWSGISIVASLLFTFLVAAQTYSVYRKSHQV